MKIKIVGTILTTSAILIMPAIADAHVIVTPNRADVGQELVFNVSVPNERRSNVSSVKLDIPHGIGTVLPTAMPGWSIVTNVSDGNVSSVTWTGTIPVGQREDFNFSAQLPANATQLDWKAYQTYVDGTVVHWDQRPSGSVDATGDSGPYSVTNVTNDLSSGVHTKNSFTKETLTLLLSVTALALSIGGLLLRYRPRT